VQSGSLALNKGAIQFATAASGHYVPATRDGKAVKGCGTFKMRFMLPVEERWPNLSRKVNALDADQQSKAEELRNEFRELRIEVETLPSPNQLALGNAGDIERLQQVAADFDSAVDHFHDYAFSYLTAIERIGESVDVPESERDAWAGNWPARRDACRTNATDFETALQIESATIDELASYLTATRTAPRADPSSLAKQRSIVTVKMQTVRLQFAQVSKSEAALRRSFVKLAFPDSKAAIP
jgi:hypothetical protein